MFSVAVSTIAWFIPRQPAFPGRMFSGTESAAGRCVTFVTFVQEFLTIPALDYGFATLILYSYNVLAKASEMANGLALSIVR